MPREIPKAYEPQEIEERWAKAWFEEKLFRAENSGDPGDQQPRFSIAAAAAERDRLDSHRAHAGAHAN